MMLALEELSAPAVSMIARVKPLRSRKRNIGSASMLLSSRATPGDGLARRRPQFHTVP
jgi:hypothetical protein